MNRQGCADVGDVIGSIYEAAINPNLWSSTLGLVTRYCGAQSACLLHKHAVSREAQWFSYYNVDPAFVDLHIARYKRLDPMGGLVLHRPGEPVPLDNIIPRNDLLDSQFFQEWSTPQRLFDCTSVVLEKTSQEFTAAVIMTDRDGGRVTGEHNRRAAYLGPHLQRAFKIGNLIELKQQERSSFAQTVDGLATGVVLVDSGGRILHANPRGQEALKGSGCLQSVRGHLMSANPQLDRALQAALAAGAKGLHQPNVAGVALPMTSRGGERYVLHTLPLTRSCIPSTGMPAAAAVAVFICPIGQYKTTAPDVIRAAFGLTPTELRVLLCLVEVGGVPDVAEELGLAVTTVKTHLGRLYAKTGLNRQADLAKLVVSLATPLAGGAEASAHRERETH